MVESVTVLASIPAILALVNLLKGLGLSGKWSAVAAVGLGISLNVATVLFDGNAIWEAVSFGAIMGLGASGLFDAARLSNPELSTKPETDIAK